MARTTAWYRTYEFVTPGSSELWNNPGAGYVGVAIDIPASDSVLRCMLALDWNTNIVANPGEHPLGIGFWGDTALSVVGVWTDAYNVGALPPSPLTAETDPGWLMIGPLQWYDLTNTNDDLGLSAVTYKWRPNPSLKWDVERSVRPIVTESDDYSVYFCWHNDQVGTYSPWNSSTTDYAANTYGSLMVATLVKTPGS